MKPYSQPTIIGVYGLLGLVGFLAGAILIPLGIKNAENPLLWLGIGSITQALLCFAISALLDHTARAAHWAEQTAIISLRSPSNGSRYGRAAG